MQQDKSLQRLPILPRATAGPALRLALAF